ncbi:hypothetical protein LTR99_006724 [Exophiala xenobiotica]|uniref:Uncharacterized protein n=1 Tax=Vermiconidia calcicola TaxID=1690605 RepID=A0AAV9Q2F6_9PEZI|nr:hypothetical protein LTR96_004987 [Exophiala xenobiotica]KAK5531721.1 hypothetical protein LTR25_008051 [Vermiconidia calcicola]KAK5299977.1 hypothetical protein LTR99_006724 [Exophiala xenobiotica]KAK5339209.1 hypothetical protein LTR98_004010 [Exophiala xenobiotica]KAK5370453.1 hypothetical protein LTS13_007043 [Exophiala xenobiotica]
MPAADGHREGAREREMHRYYQPWLETFMATENLEQVSHVPPQNDHLPRSSRDKGLTAFAQLGCLRLHAKRGIITLLDSTRQYIIAEATQSLSLLSDSQHAAGDQLWFGNSFIERDAGISADAMFPEEYTAHGPDGFFYKARALVISDIANHDRYKQRGYAGKGITFYCGVPITTKLGHVIGVYTVTDNKPRDGLSAVELNFMADMAVIVAEHLETVKNDRARTRGERLIQGIGTFIEGDISDEATPASEPPPSPGTTAPDTQSDPHDLGNDQHQNLTTAPTTPSQPNTNEPTTPSHHKTNEFKGILIGDANTPKEEHRHDTEQRQGPQRSGSDYFSRRTEANDEGSKRVPYEGGDRDDNQLEVRRPNGPKRSQSTKNKALLDSQHVFDRAATILRHCVNADGVVYVNASSANLSSGSTMNDSQSQSAVNTVQHTRNRSSRQNERTAHVEESHIHFDSGAYRDPSPQSASDSGSSTATHSASDSSITHTKKDACEVLGASIAKPYKGINITRLTLRRFIRRHPKGRCFTFDKFGRPASSDESSESASTMPEGTLHPVDGGPRSSNTTRHLTTTRALLKALPDARNIVFLPLWDSAKERWHSAVVLWSNDPTRLTNIQDDMSYLFAFNNALMNEVNRINLALSDTAKATFLANISHELRSPLHGILGSIEFLHDTPMDDFQAGMVISVETCGKTLLDTVNHVLDFAKINNLSKQNSKKLGSSRNHGYQQATNSDDSLTVDFDMALIVEEAVEAVYAGQVFRTANGDALEGKGPTLTAAGRAMDRRKAVRADISQISASNGDSVRLTLNIDDHTSWKVRSQPGAVRRVVMNILGNALKYTSEGSIDVSLELDRSRSKKHSHRHMLLKVTDTGRGMSGEFMKNHAFTAFSQEDSLATGTGLGLSIVRQIVDALGGKIDLASEKDMGTEISIWLSLPKSQEEEPLDNERDIMAQMRSQTKGLEICMLSPPLGEGKETQCKALRRMPTVETSMRNLLSQWFSIKITTADSMEGLSPNFFLYPEPPPIDYLMNCHGKPDSDREIPVIVLCTNAFEAASLRSHGLHELTDIGRIIEIISQPCGPRKLAKVLLRCMQRMNLLENSHSKNSTEHVPLSVNRTRDQSSDRPPKDATKVQGEPEHLHNKDTSRVSFAEQVNGQEPKSEGPMHSVDEMSVQNRQEEAQQSSNGKQPPDGKQSSHKKQLSNGKQSSDGGDMEKFSGDREKVDEETTQSEPHTDKRPRVLVVDDNNINLHLLVTFVRKIHHPHKSATDGLKALEAYKRSVLEEKNGFKYILMDISMPVMNGIASTQEIRKFEKEHNIQDRAKIIALTGLGSESAQNEAYQAGFDHFLSKPIKFKELQKLLQ